MAGIAGEVLWDVSDGVGSVAKGDRDGLSLHTWSCLHQQTGSSAGWRPGEAPRQRALAVPPASSTYLSGEDVP